MAVVKLCLDLTKKQAEILRETVRYWIDEMDLSGDPGRDALVAERVLNKIDAAMARE